MNRDQRRDAIERLSSSLIKRESENPPGNEQGCAEFIVDWFTKRGVNATLVPDPYDERPQAVARIGTGDPTIVLNGHIDVVPAGDADQWTYDPYDPTVEDRRLYGRGSTDMKTPLACGMLVAVELAEEIKSGDLNGSIVVQAAVGEETGAPGTKRLLDLGYDGEFGVVLEPTGLRTATSQKGLAWYEITIDGEAGHASRPSNAVNPLDSVGAVLDAIENYNRSIRSRTDELVGRSTATVTSIKTGVKENVIPGEVVVTIDRRILPSETAEGIDEEIQSILESIDIGEGVSLSWRRTKTFESAAIPSDSHLAEVFRKHTYEVDGISCSPWGDDASSDVRNFINDANMEAITWGPSDTDLAHRTDEYIQLNRAVLAHEILEEALRELLKTSGKEPS